MTIGWYSAGVRVVDISSLVGLSAGAAPAVGDTGQAGAGMNEIGFFYFPDSNAWSAKTPEITTDEAGNRSFHLFANDLQRGLDVFKFDEAAGATEVDGGTWLTPAKYLQFKRSLGIAPTSAWCSLRALQEG